MAVIKIDNFGGEFPKEPARSLPQGAATVNRNLLATATDFRPVLGAIAVAPSESNAKSIYRRQKDTTGALFTDVSQGWYSSAADDVNVVRGQILDEPVERSYITYNDGSKPPIEDSALYGTYLLGVPAPAKPQTWLLTRERFTYAKANEWLLKTFAPEGSGYITQCLSEDQYSSRFTDTNGAKMLTGGLYGKSVAGITETDPRQFVAGGFEFEFFPTGPLSQRGVSEPQNMMVRIPTAYAAAEGMANPQLGGVLKDGYYWIGINALPLWGVLNKAALAPLLMQITDPINPTAKLWDASRAASAAAAIDYLFSPNLTAVMQKRSQLDAAVQDFLAGATVSTFLVTPPAEPVAAPADTYTARKATYTKDLSDWRSKQAATVSRMVAAQKRAAEISTQIELMYTDLKTNIRTVLEDYLSGGRLERTSENPDGLVVIDRDDIVEPRHYVTTFVNSFGDESAPSLPSDLMQVYPSDLVAIKAPTVPASPLGPRSITKWRLYRTNSGSTSTEYQFVMEQAIGDLVPEPSTSTELTTYVVPGLETTNKWRDPVATWSIYTKFRGVTGSTLDVYLDHSKLRIGDTVTQADQRAGQNYNITKYWNGHAWAMQRLPVITGAVGQAGYLDGLSGEMLGEVCPSLTWLEPPTSTNPSTGRVTYLQGMVSMANGINVGFIDNMLAPSEAYVPYAFPLEYQIPVQFPIVGLCAFGNSMLVGTMGNPYFVTGNDPAQLSADKLDANQSCVSRRSMVAANGGVFYASPDGYCFASQAGVEVATAALFSREDWQKLDPSSILAAVHDNVLYFWYTGNGGGCYGLDMAARKLTRFGDDLLATAMFVDVVSDAVYAAFQGQIYQLFSASAQRLSGTWTSGLMVLPAQAPFAWGKVVSNFEAGPVTLAWTADGAVRYTKTVSSIEPFRLPPGRYLEHTLSITSQSRVTTVVMASTTEELKAV